MLTWPTEAATSTPRFWLCLLVFPTLAWLFAYGLRRFYAEDATLQHAAYAAADERQRNEVLAFAREPLALVASAYAYAAVETTTPATLIQGHLPLRPGKHIDGEKATRSGRLDWAGSGPMRERMEACFSRAISDLLPAIKAVPPSLPLRVWLQLPPETNEPCALATFRERWQAHGLPAVVPRVLPASQSIMMLDEWLDVREGSELEHVALIVALELHDQPIAGEAETMVALLLGWPPSLERGLILAPTLVHRPSDHTVIDAASVTAMALRWADLSAADIGHVWHGELTRDQKATVASVEGIRAEAMTGIDQAIGYAGDATPFLVLAIAAAHMAVTQEPQLVLCGGNTLRGLVLRPGMHDASERATSKEAIA